MLFQCKKKYKTKLNQYFSKIIPIKKPSFPTQEAT